MLLSGRQALADRWMKQQQQPFCDFFFEGGGVRLAGRLDGNWLGHWVLVSFLTPSSLGSSPSFSFFPTFWPPGGGCWPRTHTVQKKKNKNIWIQVGPHTQTAVTFLLLPGFFLFCFSNVYSLSFNIVRLCESREREKSKKIAFVNHAGGHRQQTIANYKNWKNENKKYIESSIEMRFHSIDHVVKEREREREKRKTRRPSHGKLDATSWRKKKSIRPARETQSAVDLVLVFSFFFHLKLVDPRPLPWFVDAQVLLQFALISSSCDYMIRHLSWTRRSRPFVERGRQFPGPFQIKFVLL